MLRPASPCRPEDRSAATAAELEGHWVQAARGEAGAGLVCTRLPQKRCRSRAGRLPRQRLAGLHAVGQHEVTLSPHFSPAAFPWQAEVQELFGVVDVEHRGQISREDLAAGLIDWKVGQWWPVAVPRLHAASKLPLAPVLPLLRWQWAAGVLSLRGLKHTQHPPPHLPRPPQRTRRPSRTRTRTAGWSARAARLASWTRAAAARWAPPTSPLPLAATCPPTRWTPVRLLCDLPVPARCEARAHAAFNSGPFSGCRSRSSCARLCSRRDLPAAAVHQALLEATGGRAARRASTSAAGGEVAWPAATASGGEVADDTEPRIDFDHFLCMLREQSVDLDKFDDRQGRARDRAGSLRPGG